MKKVLTKIIFNPLLMNDKDAIYGVYASDPHKPIATGDVNGNSAVYFEHEPQTLTFRTLSSKSVYYERENVRCEEDYNYVVMVPQEDNNYTPPDTVGDILTRFNEFEACKKYHNKLNDILPDDLFEL